MADINCEYYEKQKDVESSSITLSFPEKKIAIVWEVVKTIIL